MGDHLPEALRLKKTVGRMATYLQGYGDLMVKTNGWDPAVLQRFREAEAVTSIRGAIDQVATTLNDIRSDPNLAQIDGARIDALTAEVQALNAQLSDMRQNISQIPVQQIALQFRQELGRALTTRAPAPRSE